MTGDRDSILTGTGRPCRNVRKPAGSVVYGWITGGETCTVTRGDKVRALSYAVHSPGKYLFFAAWRIRAQKLMARTNLFGQGWWIRLPWTTSICKKKKEEKMALKARQYFTHVHLKLYVTYHVYLHTCLWQVHVVPNDVSTNDSITGGTHSFCSLPVFYFIKSVSCNWNPHTFWTKCYLDAIFFQRRVWLSYSYFKKTTCYSPKEMDCSLGV